MLKGRYTWWLGESMEQHPYRTPSLHQAVPHDWCGVEQTGQRLSEYIQYKNPINIGPCFPSEMYHWVICLITLIDLLSLSAEHHSLSSTRSALYDVLACCFGTWLTSMGRQLWTSYSWRPCHSSEKIPGLGDRSPPGTKVASWCCGRALDSRSRGRGFGSRLGTMA